MSWSKPYVILKPPDPRNRKSYYREARRLTAKPPQRYYFFHVLRPRRYGIVVSSS